MVSLTSLPSASSRSGELCTAEASSKRKDRPRQAGFRKHHHVRQRLDLRVQPAQGTDLWEGVVHGRRQGDRAASMPRYPTILAVRCSSTSSPQGSLPLCVWCSFRGELLHPQGHTQRLHHLCCDEATQLQGEGEVRLQRLLRPGRRGWDTVPEHRELVLQASLQRWVVRTSQHFKANCWPKCFTE